MRQGHVKIKQFESINSKGNEFSAFYSEVNRFPKSPCLCLDNKILLIICLFVSQVNWVSLGIVSIWASVPILFIPGCFPHTSGWWFFTQQTVLVFLSCLLFWLRSAAFAFFEFVWCSVGFLLANFGLVSYLMLIQFVFFLVYNLC